LIHAGIENMNEYKQAWMVEAGMVRPTNAPQVKMEQHTFSDKIKHHVKDEIVQSIVTAAAFSLFTHAAQSQISGPVGIALRTGGRVAIRAIPVIGVAWAAYSIYDYFS
jgi:hypothetical protein